MVFAVDGGVTVPDVFGARWATPSSSPRPVPRSPLNRRRTSPSSESLRGPGISSIHAFSPREGGGSVEMVELAKQTAVEQIRARSRESMKFPGWAEPTLGERHEQGLRRRHHRRRHHRRRHRLRALEARPEDAERRHAAGGGLRIDVQLLRHHPFYYSTLDGCAMAYDGFFYWKHWATTWTPARTRHWRTSTRPGQHGHETNRTSGPCRCSGSPSAFPASESQSGSKAASASTTWTEDWIPLYTDPVSTASTWPAAPAATSSRTRGGRQGDGGAHRVLRGGQRPRCPAERYRLEHLDHEIDMPPSRDCGR